MTITGISIELQDIALASLLKFQPILSKCADSIEETFFATEGYRFIFRCLRNYFLKYTVLPTEAELSVFIQNAYTEKVALVYGSLDKIQSAYARLLTVEINSEEFAQRQVVEFIRRCNIEISLGKAQDSLQDGTIDLDKVREDLIKDLTVDFAKIVPLNLADISKVTVTRQEVFGGYNPIIIKFFIEPINSTFLYGGMSAGTLNAVCAPAGRGKTTLLINQGLYTAQQGYKVLHIFLGDMNKMDGWYRYASILSGVTTQKISKLSDEKFQAFIQKFNTSGYLGNIEIITIPAKRFTASQLVEEIASIQERGNIHYDCIIIDYDKNLADGGEDSMYKLGGQVYDTFASFAVDNLSVIMIASQPKIGFWDKEILPLEALSESSKKQEIVDFLLTLGKPVKNSSIGTLYIAKNRRGKDCKTCRISIDGDTGIMKFITEEEFTNIKMSERGK